MALAIAVRLIALFGRALVLSASCPICVAEDAPVTDWNEELQEHSTLSAGFNLDEMCSVRHVAEALSISSLT